MNAFEYQQWTGTTAVYTDSGEGTLAALNYVIMALGGEVGEIQNKFKKALRGDPGAVETTNGVTYLTPEKEQEVYDEFVGVIYYIARLAEELGVRLDRVMDNSHALLTDRQDRGVIKGNGDNR